MNDLFSFFFADVPFPRAGRKGPLSAGVIEFSTKQGKEGKRPIGKKGKVGGV